MNTPTWSIALPKWLFAFAAFGFVVLLTLSYLTGKQVSWSPFGFIDPKSSAVSSEFVTNTQQFRSELAVLESRVNSFGNESERTALLVQEIQDAVSDVPSRRELQAAGATSRELKEQLTALESKLESIESATGPEEVANALIDEHLEVLLRAIKANPNASTSGSGSTKSIANKSSRHPSQVLGATKVDLSGCTAVANRVTCSFLLEAVGVDKDKPKFAASGSRVALPTAEWVGAQLSLQMVILAT